MRLKLFFVMLISGFCGRAADHVPTVREQLESLNHCWKDRLAGVSVLDERRFVGSETDLIRLHLSLVEAELRQADISRLTAGQLKNRMKLLDVLHAYWQQGRFPVNHYHSERTPYFIDNYGTACAVGQLIISSGNGALAEIIREEYNNGYIFELAGKYPVIGAWAEHNGFALGELAWIQPCYCPSFGPGVTNVSCYGGSDGYFVPDVGGIKVKSAAYYKKINGQFQSFVSMCGGCDLPAGSYKCTVTDSADLQHDFFADILQPDSLTVTLTYLVQHCTGTVIAGVAGGSSPYTFQWFGAAGTGSVAFAACDTAGSVLVTDALGCQTLRSFTLTPTSGITEYNDRRIDLYPNPAGDLLQLAGNYSRCRFIITDVGGRTCKQGSFGEFGSALNISDLGEGVYFLRVIDKNGSSHGKFLKSRH